jgi:hypothetical protein
VALSEFGITGVRSGKTSAAEKIKLLLISVPWMFVEGAVRNKTPWSALKFAVTFELRDALQ